MGLQADALQCMQSALRWLQHEHRSRALHGSIWAPYVFLMTQPEPIAAVAPVEPFLTGYDMDHLVTYLRLLDADAEGADWREVARIVLNLDAEKEPERTKQ